MNSTAKPKLALYWAASCGGCEIAVLGIDTKILDVAEAFARAFEQAARIGFIRRRERNLLAEPVDGHGYLA